MAKRHDDVDGSKDDLTNDVESTRNDSTGAEPTQDALREGDAHAEQEHSIGRRTFMKSISAVAALGGMSTLTGNASASSDLDAALDPSGEVTLEAGEYSWDGTGLDVGSGDAVVGGGNPGDTVVNLDSGTMSGHIKGRLENIVFRGANHEAVSGIDLYPGATVDGFVWPEGGQRDRDKGLYTPEGGNDRLTIRNSAWAWMVNNGAYIDKPPVTVENCAAVNNNIAGVRVGHRRGTDESETTYVRNTLIAVTDDIPNDSTNSSNGRGIRLRHPANLVIENCWFVYLDVDGAGHLVALHDNAAGSTVTIRNCAFYNDGGGDLVRDKTGGEVDVTIENCTVAGSGNRTIDPDYSGSGVTQDDSASFPLPSEVTGYAVADEIDGVGDGIGPWDSNATVASSDGTYEHTLVLHADPDNSSAIDVSFTVDGSVDFGTEAEPDVDTIVENDDGTTTVTSVELDPDGLDSFRFDGSVVDYSVPDGANVDVSLDGTTTTFAQLVGEEDVLEVVARQSGDLNYEFVVEGTVDLHATSDTVTAGHGDSVTDNGDGTVTVTGYTGNDGYGDAYLVDGQILSFDWEQQDYEFDVVLNGDAVDPTQFGSEQDVLEVIARQAGDLNYEFVVEGTVDLHATSDTVTAGHGDSVTDNGDGTVTVTGYTGNDGYGDAYLVDGQILSFDWEQQDYEFDVVLNGDAVDPTQFGSEQDVLEVIARQAGDLNYEFVVEGTVDLHATSDTVTAGHGDSVTDNGDGTVTVTGYTGNDGYGDAYLVDGQILSFDWEQQDYEFDVVLNGDAVDPTQFGSEEEADESLPHLLTVDGDSEEATLYTFTVSGDVVRDEDLSEPGSEGTRWDRVEDFAADGKVIGLVGSGFDAYRYSGEITDITVDGDATVTRDRNA